MFINFWGIGCYLSYRKVWLKIVDEQLDFVLVFEDDYYQ
ncbi:hypothetical protein C427_0058 [Paraglaciecola psychrophila 170]|uniref:Glycosyl transferase family 25 domain-containing protein n=1 Tax=Paraglaciecola psychrophila 170 TaxID=1129794 RepID=K6Z3N3_9ALTE|nr:hypothetical protein C427_0058 [Paraglaciecola psychrophila 170]GAC39674.1 hypothetical protein GPSY_4063 [Paraglaciecola psychrophila 170]